MTRLVINKFQTDLNPTLSLGIHSKNAFEYVLRNGGDFVQVKMS